MSELSDNITSFQALSLTPAVLQAVQAAGYDTPTPIQAKSIPYLLEGRDLLGLAQTGTGKTAAFALPLLSRVDVKQRDPQILVLVPTRELAIQVAEAFQNYSRYMLGLHALPIYGGQDMRGQLRCLQRGSHIIIGTPGRVMDHIRRGSLRLDGIKTVVLDEADEMLRMGFIDDIEWVMERAPASRQIALFSATMPPVIRKIADKYLNSPAYVDIKAKTTTVDTITQKVWMVRGIHKLDALTRIVETESFDAMLIFVRTKTATAELAEKLEARGFSAAALNGDMSQGLREKVVERIKRGSLDLLIATDVAARGLDVERISHVVNYDIPYDTEAYVHRIGRTGRAGRKGIAILFAAHREKRMLLAIERATRQRIEVMTLPSMSDVRDIRIKQFKNDVISSMDDSEKLTPFKEIVTSLVQEHNLSLEDLAASLCYLAQKNRPFPDASEPEPRQRKEYNNKPNSVRVKTSGGRREGGRERREMSTEGMVRYRVGLGREQGVSPRDLVGAIANEGGIPGSNIGHIRLFESCSSVYLPENLDDRTLTMLKSVKIRNKNLAIRPWLEGGSRSRVSDRRNTPSYRESSSRSNNADSEERKRDSRDEHDAKELTSIR
ncbi:MAG: DEAD/DEAH box helicase [Candidatus Endonucleobacter bathymodioli]|uniref:ATP-dependent RNA helicase DeaD n=1 Tax=Candidatus Endonucleibacter bathymodioli TaxID=539814 RepID=A0AA90NMN3_9GAMM|nr:DEAD/DEAH box helicase [Candidatus Endonucleobacter bathymodioli]